MQCVRIIGGGVAGLTLGLELRARGIPTTLIEAGHYPRHRVCGEYISGAGVEVLRRLGLYEFFLQEGGREARTVRFLANGRPARSWDSRTPALAISRFQMDHLLAERFQEAGGELVTGKRFGGNYAEEGVVRATGRRVHRNEGWRWIGIKAHAMKQSGGAADLEMHFGRSGYAGVARLAGDRVNVCALLGTRGPIPHLDEKWRGMLEAMIGERAMVWDSGSFAAVAGFSFQTTEIPEGECSVGDAIGMIPPLTGNGMSIALESAALAAGPLSAHATGELSWTDACRQVRERSHSHFLERLRWANLVQKLVFTAAGQGLLRLLVARCEWVVPFLFARTR